MNTESTDGKLIFAGYLIRVKRNESIFNSELLFQFLTTSKYWQIGSLFRKKWYNSGYKWNEYAVNALGLPPLIQEQQKIADCLIISRWIN